MRTILIKIIAYMLLAITIAGAVLAFATVQVMSKPRINGAGPGYRYYSLGIVRSTGTSFLVSSTLVANLNHVLPRVVAAAVSYSKAISFALPSSATKASQLNAELITGDYAQVLHLHTLAGRLINESDLQDDASGAMLSTTTARRFFGSAIAAVGRNLIIGAERKHPIVMRVVGVLPAGYDGLSNARSTSIWMPYTKILALKGVTLGTTPPSAKNPADHHFTIRATAVLSAPANMSAAAVQTLLQQAWSRLSTSTRGKDTRGLVLSVPFSQYPQARVKAVRRASLYLAVAVASLVLATINVFTLRWLTLVRRRKVLQLEHVLGATRIWLLLSFTRRTVYVAVLMLLLASALTTAAFVVLKHLLPTGPPWDMLTAPHVLGELAWALPLLVAVVAAGEALPLGILLLREQLDGVHSMTLSHADRHIVIGVLVAEALLAAMMSCAAAWAVMFAWQQRHADLGMLQQSATIVTLRRKPSLELDYMLSNGAPASNLLFNALARAVSSSQPNTRVATGPGPGLAMGTWSALQTYQSRHRVTSARAFMASPEWLRVASVKVLAGHGFSSTKPDPTAVLVDALVARALFGSVHAAVGQSLTGSYIIPHSPPTKHIIGVIAPLLLHGPSSDPVPVIINNVRTDPFGTFRLLGGSLFIRPAIPTDRYSQLRTTINVVLKHQAPALKFESIQSSTQVLEKLTAPQTRMAQVFLAIALFAWAIALSGVFVHLRLYLAMRKRLTAIRSALGAGPGRLYREVVWGVLGLASAGTALALLATPWLAQQFAFLSGTQVSPFGAATWIALAILLLAVFLVAHFPARRAARTEPAESLHEL